MSRQAEYKLRCDVPDCTTRAVWLEFLNQTPRDWTMGEKTHTGSRSGQTITTFINLCPQHLGWKQPKESAL